MPRLTAATARLITAAPPAQTKDRLADSGYFTSGAGFNAAVRAAIRLANGQIMIGGQFSTYAGAVAQGSLTLINRDGTIAAFPAQFGNSVWTLAQQADGRILVGGDFINYNGQTRNRIVRLNLDGTEDTAFYANTVAGLPSNVRHIELQSDGRILVMGVQLLRRYNTDGTQDNTFLTGNANATIRHAQVQSDGKIVVVGDFTAWQGATRNRIVRLNSDGSEDTAFYNNLGFGAGFNAVIWRCLIQSDGRILIASQGTITGTANVFLVRLNSTGSEDTAFYANLGTLNDRCMALAEQSDGRILVGGNFTTLAGQAQVRLMRLLNTGSRDTSFPTFSGGGANALIYGLEVMPDDSILVTGEFTTWDGDTVGRIVKLDAQGQRQPRLQAVSYSVAGSVSNQDEGAPLTVTVTTQSVASGTTLRWRIIDRPEDFQVDTGLVTVVNNTATFDVTARADLLLEGEETFRVRLETLLGTVVATSGNLVINDSSFPTLIITGSDSLDEGATTEYTITQAEGGIYLDGTQFNWLARTDSGSIEITGQFTLASGAATIAVSVPSDFTLNGQRPGTLTIRTVSTDTLVATKIVTFNDNQTPTYAVAADAASVDEGGSVSFTVTTQGVSEGTELYWTLGTGISDFASGSGLSFGSFNVASGGVTTAAFSVSPTIDGTLEGPETFTVQIRTGSTSGTVVATSDAVTINDTSNSPTYSLSAPASINEGSAGTFTVTTLGVSNSTTLYWTVLHGSTVSADFLADNGTVVIDNNTGSFTITAVADQTTEGTQEFRVQLRTGSVEGPIVALTNDVLINDTSLSFSYDITPASTSVNEGTALTVSVTTSRVPDNTTLYWTINSNTGDFSTSSGSVNIGLKGGEVKLSVGSEENQPEGFFFRDTGTQMFLIGQTNDRVSAWTMSTPWDVSTAVVTSTFSVAAREAQPSDVFFKPDGTAMYVLGFASDNIIQYSLGTPWDITTAVFVRDRSVLGQDTIMQGFFFKPDGTEVYVIGRANDNVYQYTMSTAWDISTMSFAGQVSTTTANEFSPEDVFFKPDGSLMFVFGGNLRIATYTLSTPWDVTSAVFTNSVRINFDGSSPTGLFFHPNGTRIFTLDLFTDSVREYTIAEPWDMLTGLGADILITPTADLTTEGSETFTVSLRTDSISGPIVATTPTITINDSSLDLATLVYSIPGPGTGFSDRFGEFISINDTYFAVSAPNFDELSGASNTGRVYIYRLSDGQLVRTLTTPNPNIDNGFARELCLLPNDRIAIAGRNNTNVVGGDVYIYDILTGIRTNTIVNPDVDNNQSSADQFGKNLAVSPDGTRMIVAAPFDGNSAVLNQGVVHVYDTNDFTRLFNVQHNDNESINSDGNDGFADSPGSIACNNSVFIVGIYTQNSATNNDQGQAALYSLSSNTRLNVFTSPVAQTNLYFGNAVAINSTHVFIGARGLTVSGQTNSGAVYVYRLSDYQLVATLLDSSPRSSQFGTSVAASDSLIFVGAPSLNSISGAVLVFSAVDFSLLTTVLNPNPFGTGSFDQFGFRVSVSGNRWITAASGEDSVANSNTGYAYVYSS